MEKMRGKLTQYLRTGKRGTFPLFFSTGTHKRLNILYRVLSKVICDHQVWF